MSDKIIYRYNKKFIVNKNSIKEKFRTDDVINALYAAIYDEFKGADKSEKYGKLNYFDRMKSLNEFARNWLQNRGYLDG